MNMFTEYVHPKGSQAAFKTGSYLYIVIGLSHLSLELISNLTRDPLAYETFTVNMPIVPLLGRDVAYHVLATGFSYAMGLLLIGFGLSFLLHPYPTPRLVGLALTISLLMLLISLQFFFIVPVVTMGLAALSFAFALRPAHLQGTAS